MNVSKKQNNHLFETLFKELSRFLPNIKIEREKRKMIIKDIETLKTITLFFNKDLNRIVNIHLFNKKDLELSIAKRFLPKSFTENISLKKITQTIRTIASELFEGNYEKKVYRLWKRTQFIEYSFGRQPSWKLKYCHRMRWIEIISVYILIIGIPYVLIKNALVSNGYIGSVTLVRGK